MRKFCLCLIPTVKRPIDTKSNDATLPNDHLEDVIEKFPDNVIQELLPEEFAKIISTRQKKQEKLNKKSLKEKKDSKLLLSDAKVPEY